jgi:Protein of unknown function (DUF2985)
MASVNEDERGNDEQGEEAEFRPCEQQRINELDPKMSLAETWRDHLLRLLDGRLFQAIGLTVLLLIVADGAFFFFLLMGWHGMCTPRTDCEPRNYWYNVAVQFLTALFTYTALVSMPWRCTNALHIFGCSCPYRQNSVGSDLYGFPSNDIWFHIPLSKRCGILSFLLLNCLTQFANQYTRLVYSTFDAQNTTPGNIWTGVFFLCSMLCAAIGGAWLVYEESKLRKSSPPGKFPPGLLQVIGEYFRRCRKGKEEPLESNQGDVAVEESEGPVPDVFDPTRHPSLHDITPASRGAMRLFGM